ncbi:MAG: hypothetical protein JXQ76_00790 [Campylobacterales bacterium]|nr:hypothetical protein [Campylobacterales bacterium]
MQKLQTNQNFFNIQPELLKLYSTDVQEAELKDIKSFLAQYFTPFIIIIFINFGIKLSNWLFGFLGGIIGASYCTAMIWCIEMHPTD